MITPLLFAAFLLLAASGDAPSVEGGDTLFAVARLLSFATLVPVFLVLLDQYVSGRRAPQ